VLAICIVLGSFVPTGVAAARRVSSCDEMVKTWTSAPAKNKRSRTSYIKWKKDNYYDVLISITVRPLVYKNNASFDFDKDGILCEEFYESRAVAENKARAMAVFAEIISCRIKFWNWDSSRGICIQP
jgi:hypothetical protein